MSALSMSALGPAYNNFAGMDSFLAGFTTDNGGSPGVMGVNQKAIPAGQLAKLGGETPAHLKAFEIKSTGAPSEKVAAAAPVVASAAKTGFQQPQIRRAKPLTLDS
jgi:hypothetical protein